MIGDRMAAAPHPAAGPPRRGTGRPTPRPGTSPCLTARVAWVLAAGLAAGPAGAQSVAFGPAVAVPAAVPPVQAALAPWTSPPALDLFVVEPRPSTPSGAFLYRHGDLASVAFPGPSPLAFATCFTAGSWVGEGLLGTPGDGLADLAWCHVSDLGYQLSPGLTLETVLLYQGDSVPTGLAFARLLDRTDLVLAVAERQEIEIAPDPRDTRFFYDHFYRYPYVTDGTVLPDSGDTFALQPLRLGDVARSAGLHDLAWSRVGLPDLFVLWTLVDSPTADPANWGGALLTFSGALEVRGAGAVDVDGDRIPDLLAVVVTSGSPRLVAVHNPGTPFSLDPGTAVDVGAAIGLVAPSFAAPLDLDGVPAAAVLDAGASPPRLHVVTANPAGGLLDWSTASLAGTGVTQVLAGDLLGSAAADLVAVFADGAIQVWPGDLPPSIAWAPGSPPLTAGTLAPLVLSVDASDPDGQVASVALDIQGQPSGIVPVQSGSSYTFTVPIATLCGLGPSSASFAVRATDDLGAWREVAAPIAISDAPSLQLTGAGSTVAVPLLPGGTSVTLTAQVFDGCGRTVNVAWSYDVLPGVTVTPVQDGQASVLTIAVPESAYQAMVAGGDMSMVVTATATGAPPSAPVTLGFDASGLLAADHRSDRTALAPGELALLTTTLRSRIGVALTQVALDDRLAGLAAAGPVRVSGAVILAQVNGPDGLSVTLDQVPGGGAPVVVELPVRLLEGSGGSSRAQALAVGPGLVASWVPLSPASTVEAPAPTPAGLSCGSGGGSPLVLLGLVLYVKVARRARARIRSTSSRIPMRRQA